MSAIAIPGERGPPPGTSDNAFTSPAWATGGYFSSFVTTSVDTGVTTLLAKNNPRRIGLGFIANAALERISLGPFADPASFSFAELTGKESIFWSITELGVLICQEWYGTGTGFAPVRILEVVSRLRS